MKFEIQKISIKIDKIVSKIMQEKRKKLLQKLLNWQLKKIKDCLIRKYFSWQHCKMKIAYMKKKLEEHLLGQDGNGLRKGKRIPNTSLIWKYKIVSHQQLAN